MYLFYIMLWQSIMYTYHNILHTIIYSKYTINIQYFIIFMCFPEIYKSLEKLWFEAYRLSCLITGINFNVLRDYFRIITFTDGN